jgi:hypothetical protein
MNEETTAAADLEARVDVMEDNLSMLADSISETVHITVERSPLRLDEYWGLLEGVAVTRRFKEVSFWEADNGEPLDKVVDDIQAEIRLEGGIRISVSLDHTWSIE